MEVTFGLAFAAGFISFISPCVLPLVPAYITYMGGRVTNTVAAQAVAGGGQVSGGGAVLTRVSTGIHSLFFVLGFSLIFVGIGLLSTAFIRQVGGANISAVTDIIGRAGGVVIIIFGLHFMDALSPTFNRIRKNKESINFVSSLVGLLIGGAIILWAFDRPPSAFAQNTNIFYRTIISLPIFTAYLMWFVLGGAFTNPRAFWVSLMDNIELALYSDTRQQMTGSGKNGFGGSFLMGLVFAAGWTPCIGPIYGAILTLAANGGSITEAGGMLTAYSMGLGIPFIVTALMLDGAQGFLRNLNRHMRTIKIVSGVFLILVGVLVASGQLQRISSIGANGSLSEISFRMEECFTGAVAGDVPWGSLIACINDNYEADASSNLEGLSSGDVSEESIEISGFTTETETTETSDEIIIGTSLGNVAPDFTTFTANGEPVQLVNLRGQVVLLNFWATWCGPCRIEMPEFQRAFEEMGDDGFTIVAVNNQEKATQVQDFQESFGLTFPLVMDLQGSIQNQYGIVNYPSTYLLDENGIVIGRHFGPLTTSQINEMIKDALQS